MSPSLVHRLRDPHAGPIPARAGIGLRMPHHRQVLDQGRGADWLEVHPENYLNGPQADELEMIRRDHPLSLHAVGLSLGSVECPRTDHLERLAGAITRYQPGLVSEHLSFSRANGAYLPDLLPLPYSEEALAVVARNVDHAQAALKRQLLIENPSTYARLPGADMTEAEFLAELVMRTGCGLLLDINNICVSARNRGDDPFHVLPRYLRTLPPGAVGEIHLAGHAVRVIDRRMMRIDDHGSPVSEEVWRLYQVAIAALGDCPTLIEWDTDIPPLETLQAEAATAQTVMDTITKEDMRYALAG